MYLFKEYQFLSNKILHLRGFRYTVKDITISKARVSFWLAESPALFHYSLLAEIESSCRGFDFLLCISIKGFISGMYSNKAISVIYLCSLKENHFTEVMLLLTKPNSIVTAPFNDFSGSSSHQGIWMAFLGKTVSLDRVRGLCFKWTGKVLAQDQFLLYMPLKLFYFISLLVV